MRLINQHLPHSIGEPANSYSVNEYRWIPVPLHNFGHVSATKTVYTPVKFPKLSATAYPHPCRRNPVNFNTVPISFERRKLTPFISFSLYQWYSGDDRTLRVQSQCSSNQHSHQWTSGGFPFQDFSQGTGSTHPNDPRFLGNSPSHRWGFVWPETTEKTHNWLIKSFVTPQFFPLYCLP